MDDGLTRVSVVTGKDDGAGTELGEVGRTRNDAREGEVVVAEVGRADRTILIQGDVTRVAEAWGRPRGHDGAQAGKAIGREGGVSTPSLGDGDTVRQANRSDATRALVDAEVDVVPTSGGRDEGTRGVHVPDGVIQDNITTDGESHAVVEGFLEVPGAGREVNLTDETTRGVIRHHIARRIMERAEVSRDDRVSRNGRGARVTRQVEGAKGLVVIEGDTATVEDHGTGARGARHILTDGEKAGIDQDATREGVARGVQREGTRTRLREAEGAGDRAVDGQGLGADVNRRVRRQGHRAITEAQGVGTREVDIASRVEGRGRGDVHVGTAGVIEGDARRERNRARTEGVEAIDVEVTRRDGEATREGVGAAQGELAVAGLGQGTRPDEVLVDGQVAADGVQGKRTVQRNIAVGVARQGEGLADVDRCVAEGATSDGVDREVLAGGLRVTGDDHRTAVEDAASRVVGELAHAGISVVRHRPGRAGVHRHDGGVIVSAVIDTTSRGHLQGGAVVQGDVARVIEGGADLGVTRPDREAAEGVGVREFHRAAGGDRGADGDRTEEGISARERQGARTNLIQAQCVAGGVADDAREGRGRVTGADRERARVGVRCDGTGAAEATDDFRTGRHHEAAGRVDNERSVVRDAVQGATGGSADLHIACTREGHVTGEGVREAEAEDGAARADEGDVTRTGDRIEVGAVSGVRVEEHVAGERDTAEAHDASASNVSRGTKGDRARAVSRDEDRGREVSRWASAIDVEGQVIGAGVDVTDGDGARGERTLMLHVDATLAEHRACGVGVRCGAREGQHTRPSLHDAAITTQRIACGGGDDVIGRGIIEGRSGRLDIACQRDALTDAEGIVKGHHVTVDELIGDERRVVGEVRGRVVIPDEEARGIAPGELAEAELQGRAGGADIEGRGVTVAGGTGEDEVRARGVRRTVIQDGERCGASGAREQVDLDLVGAVNRERIGGGQERGRSRVSRERGVVTEGDRLGGTETLEVRTGGDGEVRAWDITGEVERTSADEGGTGVGLRTLDGHATGALLGHAARAREDGVDGLYTGRREEERAAARGVDCAAAKDIVLEREAVGVRDRVERVARAGDGDVRGDGRVRAGGGVADRTTGPIEETREEIIGDEAGARVEDQGTAGEVVRTDLPVDGRRATAVIQDDPRGRDGAAGLVEDADAVDADVKTAPLLTTAGWGRTRSRVAGTDEERTRREVIRADRATPVADAETIGAEHADRATRLVERTAQVRAFTQVDAVDLDFRTRVDVEGGPVIDGRDLDVTARGAEVRKEELTPVHREARARRLDLDIGFGHIGGTADIRDRADDLASAERVAIGAVEA